MSINATLIVQMVTFAAFVLFTMKFVWPPIAKMLEQRRAKIAEGLAAADKGEQILSEARAEADRLIRETRDRATLIVRRAEDRSLQIVTQAEAEAAKAAERFLVKARSNLEQEVRAARDALRKEMADVALAAAGRIVRAEIDGGRHKDLLAVVSKDWN